MMVVNSYVAPSEIHGFGCFAAQAVKKGTVVWRRHPKIDPFVTLDEIADMEKDGAWHIGASVYWCIASQQYVYCGDLGRYWNHSDAPNTVMNGEECIACKAMGKDEEITCDYRQFDLEIDPLWK